MATLPVTIPLSTNSPYRHSVAYQTEDGKIFFSLPERITFVDRNDTQIHIVTDGEYLWDLAIRYYGMLVDRPHTLWWVIGEFQPTPIQDGSVKLKAGTEIHIPSLDFIEEVVNGPSLVDEPALL